MQPSNQHIHIKYCDKHPEGASNMMSCANLAIYKAKLTFEGSGNVRTVYRCEKHKSKSTTGGKIISENDIEPFDQSENIGKVNIFLNSLIGKIVPNKMKWKFAVGKYLKENCGIMCFNEKTKKYKFIYYSQIKLNELQENGDK